MRVLNPLSNQPEVAAIRQAFSRLFPYLGDIKITQAWAGMLDVMPDIVPVIDCATAIPGLTIGTGVSGHGFGIGPGVGRVLAALVTGGDVGHDLRRFRLNLFSDGTPTRIGPSL